MSPLVQRSRPTSGRQADPTDQFWGMLLFESLSAGVMALFVGFVAVLAVVGIYVIIVWPLTFWDLGNLGLERYAEAPRTVWRPRTWAGPSSAEQEPIRMLFSVTPGVWAAAKEIPIASVNSSDSVMRKQKWTAPAP